MLTMSQLLTLSKFTSVPRHKYNPTPSRNQLLSRPWQPQRQLPQLVRAASASEHMIPWSLFVAEQGKAAQRLEGRIIEIGELRAQKKQLLQDLVYARGEIDVRGAMESIARIEEARMPSTKQRRGVQLVLRWLVMHDQNLQKKAQTDMQK